MPRASSWSGSRAGCACRSGLFLIGWLVLAAAAPAATVLERTVHVRIQDDGSLRESSRLRVRLDDADDVRAWAAYRVPLDENRDLVRLEARIVLPGGEVLRLGPDDQDTVERTGGGVFYSSRRWRVVRLRGLVPGAVVEVDEEVAHRPYYPTGKVLLRGEAPTERLEVRVDGGGEAWRYRLAGEAGGLEVEEAPGGVVVRGERLRAWELPELAPEDAAVRPVLRFGWGNGTWDDVGRWYDELAASVPRGGEAIREQAQTITADLEEPRQRLDALTRFLQEKVRYVAVLIGVGGYRPSPPQEVLERRWGDCKDKSTLLVDLLRAAGVEAYPVLLRSGRRGRIDPLFPAVDELNHALVAVPREALDGPGSNGSSYLFVDPTLTAGAGAWIHPATQDQDVLVVRGDGAELVRTPLRPEDEHRRLSLDLTVSPEGDGRGTATLELRGELAYELGASFAATPERAEAEARSILAGLLPGADLDDVGSSRSSDAVPAIELHAAVALHALVQGTPGRRSLELPGMRATPEPQRLDDERRVAVVLPARSVEASWKLRLPEDWCPAVERHDAVENEVGSFEQDVTSEGGELRVERRLVLRRRWMEPEALQDLKDLALAEHRAHRRRLRLRCEG